MSPYKDIKFVPNNDIIKLPRRFSNEKAMS
jgi:hypothetical protein